MNGERRRKGWVKRWEGKWRGRGENGKKGEEMGRRGGLEGGVEAYGFGAEAPPTPNQRQSFTCYLHGLQGRIVAKLCLWLRVGLLGSPMTDRKVTDNRNYRQDNILHTIIIIKTTFLAPWA